MGNAILDTHLPTVMLDLARMMEPAAVLDLITKSDALRWS
jgi:hypothetical protein